MEPEMVLTNLSRALSAHRSDYYLLSFNSANFRFDADNVALSADPGLQDWSFAKEMNHADKLFSDSTLHKDSTLKVIFSDTLFSDHGDSLEINATYQLQAQLKWPGSPRLMAGSAQFILRRGSDGYWQITQWRDTRAEASNTWSNLKSSVR
jgi:ketosteroid isomerase-like protein